MEIKPIRTKSDYRQALKEIESLMNAEARTPGSSPVSLQRISYR